MSLSDSAPSTGSMSNTNSGTNSAADSRVAPIVSANSLTSTKASGTGASVVNGLTPGMPGAPGSAVVDFKTHEVTQMPGLVNRWNDFDPLEEVVLGIADGACFPPMEPGCQSE